MIRTLAYRVWTHGIQSLLDFYKGRHDYALWNCSSAAGVGPSENNSNYLHPSMYTNNFHASYI